MLRQGNHHENWNNLTLKEKFRIHYDNKNDLHVTTHDIHKALDIICIGITWYLSISLITISHVILIPGIWHERPSVQFFMKVLSWIIFFQFLMNWVLTFVTPTFHRGGETLTQSSLGWRNCPKCQHDAPPRSHHCPVCNICILKRDHHCFFIGKCVGYFNQRRYIVTCFYMASGCLTGFVLLVLYTKDSLSLFNSFWAYCPPIALWDWIQGKLSTSLGYLLCQLYLCIIFGCIAVFFFLHQCRMIVQGQTAYEAVRSICRFRKDVASNIQSSFGHHWLIHFFLPFPSNLGGDGIEWT